MSIALTFGMRTSLNSLQGLDSLINVTNKRISTGKKVNDVLDGPALYFQAQAFDRSSRDYNSILDNMGVAVKGLQKAITTTEAGAKLLETAQGLARQAITSTGTARTDLLAQIGTILTAGTGEFDKLTNDGGFNGKNLLRTLATNDLKIDFDPTSGSSLTVTASDLKINATGLTVTAAGYVPAATAAQINTLIGELNTGISTARTRGTTLGATLNIVTLRQQFAKDSSTLLKETAERLTAADLNEEGANLTSLQTRQQMAVTALSLSSRSDQAILRLF
jgi:flagellin